MPVGAIMMRWVPRQISEFLSFFWDRLDAANERGTKGVGAVGESRTSLIPKLEKPSKNFCIGSRRSIAPRRSVHGREGESRDEKTVVGGCGGGSARAPANGGFGYLLYRMYCGRRGVLSVGRVGASYFFCEDVVVSSRGNLTVKTRLRNYGE